MIQVKVVPGMTLAETVFDVSGTGKASFPSTDLLEAAVYTYFERRKGWDFFQGVHPVVRTDKATVEAAITGQHVNVPVLTPSAINHALWDNSDEKTPTTFKAELSAAVKASTSVTWEESATVGFSFAVGVEVNEAGVKVTGTTTYSFSATVGHSTSKSVEREVGVTGGVERDVPGGEVDVAILLIQSGRLSADVMFQRAYSGPLLWKPRYSGVWQPLSFAALEADGGALRPLTARANFGCDFATDTDIKIVPAASGSAADVDAAIQKALDEERKAA